jgi:FKBP-type peptidyl-prolyl cis-trans isomerase
MNKNFLWVGIGIATITIIAAILFTRTSGNNKVPDNSTAITPFPTISEQVTQIIEEGTTTAHQATKSATENATITPMQEVTELIVEDLAEGTGDKAVSGKKITVNYKGTLTDGTQFDSSYDRGQPFTFTLGTGQVIQGWDQGFEGMKVGGKRKLTIPSELGYGSREMGTIPPNSVLIFEVELLEVE